MEDTSYNDPTSSGETKGGAISLGKGLYTALFGRLDFSILRDRDYSIEKEITMGWLMGAGVGFMLGGPLGAVVGGAMQHVMSGKGLGQAVRPTSKATGEQVFISNLVAIMTKISMADGTISGTERKTIHNFFSKSLRYRGVELDFIDARLKDPVQKPSLSWCGA